MAAAEEDDANKNGFDRYELIYSLCHVILVQALCELRGRMNTVHYPSETASMALSCKAESASGYHVCTHAIYGPPNILRTLLAMWEGPSPVARCTRS